MCSDFLFCLLRGFLKKRKRLIHISDFWHKIIPVPIKMVNYIFMVVINVLLLLFGFFVGFKKKKLFVLKISKTGFMKLILHVFYIYKFML